MMTNREFFDKTVKDIKNLSSIKMYIAQGNEDILISVDDAINTIRTVFAFKFWNVITQEFKCKDDPILSENPSTYIESREIYTNAHNSYICVIRLKIGDDFYYKFTNSNNKYLYPEFAMVECYLTRNNKWNNECVTHYYPQFYSTKQNNVVRGSENDK